MYIKEENFIRELHIRRLFPSILHGSFRENISYVNNMALIEAHT